MNRYRHHHCSFSSLAHAIMNDNVAMTLKLLEKGGNMRNRNSRGKNSILAWHKSLFNIIGKPAFLPVLVQMLEMIKDPVLDENSNTVFHIICQKKLTLWLQKLLDSPSQHHLFLYANNEGCLPMHIAAKVNFLEFFNLVFSDVSCSKHCLGEDQVIAADQVSLQKVRKENREDMGTSRVSHIKERTCAKKNPNMKCEVRDISTRRMLKYQTDIGKVIGEQCRRELYGQASTRSLVLDTNSPIVGKGDTVLHIAVEFKLKELIKILVEHGANVNASHRYLGSPLFSCLNSNGLGKKDPPTDVVDVCRYLISAGADVNQYSTFQLSMLEDDVFTPLHLAAKRGHHKDVIELLINNTADPKATSKKLCKLPLQMALEEDQTDSAVVLLNENFYPDRFLANFVDNASNTLLHSAGNCHESIIVKLMNLGCPLDQPNVNNVFPLDRAIFFGNVSFIHVVLSCCPEIVNRTKHNKVCPPLHLAATSALDGLPLCQILLSYGADIYAKAYGKNMAYRRALRNDCYKNAVYLCELMSRPFTLVEKKELLDCAESRMDSESALRLRCRLGNVPSLLSHCLDSVRQVVLKNRLSFKDVHKLPIPDKMMSALKYHDAIQL